MKTTNEGDTMKSIKYLIIIIIVNISQIWAGEIDCRQWMEKLEAAKKDIPTLGIVLSQIVQIKTNCNDPKEMEKEVFDSFWLLETKKNLDPSLLLLVKAIKKDYKIPALENISDEVAVGTLGLTIRSELFDRGYYNKNFSFKGWEKITAEQDKLLRSLPRVYSFKNSSFKSILKRLTGTQMTSVSKPEVLAQNGEALERRIELIRNAKSSIKLLTWGFYDDFVGKKVADELIIKAQDQKNKVRIQVMVDFQVSQRPGYKDQLARLKNSGIEVIGWKSELNPFYGMHSKMLIVDDLRCIEGGRNIGNDYLIDNKWSDLDVYHEGTIARIINPNIFAKLWNDQVKLQNLSIRMLPMKDERNLLSGDTATFMSTPEFDSTDLVSNLTLYVIQNAKHEIDITNAYFILTPGIKKALTDAINRGVKVRIYSNSMKSVDEFIVSVPIQKSLKEMYEAGAEIYMKTGQTLHTKVFRADDLGWYGSYNLHPRSGRYELEKLTVTTNESLNKELDKAMEGYMKLGSRALNIQELAYPGNAGMQILFNSIFNQL